MRRKIMEEMSTCSVATGLLALVAVIHFAITVVLTVLVVWVRCYCKLRGSVVSAKQPEDRRTSTDTERGPDNSVAFRRHLGQVELPDLSGKETVLPPDDISEKVPLSASLPVPGLELYGNQGASETLEGSEKSPEQRNKTIEELRRDSTSSMKKPSSPFRRISSPLTRSGRFSITSFFGRRSMDMEAEAVNLMAPQVASPTEEGALLTIASSLEVLAGSTQHILQHNEEGDKSSKGSTPEHHHNIVAEGTVTLHNIVAGGTITPPPTIVILPTADESQC